MSKLFQIAKRRIATAIDARYLGYSVEKSYKDYVMFRYFGHNLLIIEDQPKNEDGQDVIKITHENASNNPRAYRREFCAEFSETYQIADMLRELLPRPLTPLSKLKIPTADKRKNRNNC